MKKLCFCIFYFLFVSTGISQAVDFTFSTSDNLFCAPSVVNFVQQSTGSPVAYIWDFGNGQSNAANPSFTFTTAGTYAIKLTVIYEQSAFEVTKTIMISPAITVSIGLNRNYICQPGPVNFTAGGTASLTSYLWDFGDGSPAINTATAAITHVFANFGSFTVTLKGTAATGCTSTATAAILVSKPTLTVSASPGYGCIPSLVAFNATANLPAGSAVSNYQWNFGDGSPLLNTPAGNTSHAYTVVGGYTTTVNVTTSEGCTNSVSTGQNSFGTPPPNAIVNLPEDTICGSQSLVAMGKATNGNSYHWDFGDGSIADISDTIITHRYATLGSKILSFTPYYNGCPGQTITRNVAVTGLIAAYSFSNTCSNKSQFTFNNLSLGNATNTVWNFGDGSSAINVINPVHMFPGPGTYASSLTIKDSTTGCKDSIAVPVYFQSALLTSSDSVVCRGTNVTFNILNNTSNTNAQFNWNVAGAVSGFVQNASFSVPANTLGTFNNFVIISNGAGYCPDTLRETRRLIVRGPFLDFNALPQICLSDSFRVTNISRPFFAADSVRTWIWNFGETNLNDTVFQPAPHKYANPGTFNIKLVARDKNGCADSLARQVSVQGLPFVRAIPALDTLCFGQTSRLIAFHSDSITWTPALQLNCNTCDTVLASPTTTTQYFVTGRNAAGCTNRDSVLVKVFAPFKASSSFADSSICLNDSLQLLVMPAGKSIQWSPAAGLSATNVNNPLAFPSQTTVYKAFLQDSVGCFSDSISIGVTVNTLPTVDAGPDKVVPFNAAFTLSPVYSGNISSWAWLPAASLSCNNCAVPTGKADNTTTYHIKVTSDSGCVARDSLTVYVECRDANLLMPGAFTPDNNNLNDLYYPLTRGIRTIKKFMIYNRLGQLVFQAKNFTPNNKSYGWNGKFNGAEQQIGTYIYLLEVECDLGQSITRKGTFVLIR